ALAQAWRSLPDGVRERWQVVAVPRHPRASAELRAEAASAGQAIRTHHAAPSAGNDGAWIWDDRLGTLVRYYAAADAAIVGGTFGLYGGHNPLEPAACGAAVVVGPHHEAQLEGVRTLVAAGGATVAGDGELPAVLLRLLADDDVRRDAAAAARATVERQRGATRRAVARLATLGLWPAV